MLWGWLLHLWHTPQDAGIPSGAILEITNYLQHSTKSHQVGEHSIHPSAQQTHQMSSTSANAYIMGSYPSTHYPPAYNYPPPRTFSFAHQHHMPVDGRHMSQSPMLEGIHYSVGSSPVSPASTFPVVASPLSIHSPRSQLNHHHLQLQTPPIHQQIKCPSTSDSTLEEIGARRNLALLSTGQCVVRTTSTLSPGISKDYACVVHCSVWVYIYKARDKCV